jgi:hypothetical protein
MEKVISELSLNLVIWQLISLIIQIGIVILLYKILKFLTKYFKERKPN